MDKDELVIRLFVSVIGLIVLGLGSLGLLNIVKVILFGASQGNIYGIAAGSILLYVFGGALMILVIIGLIVFGFGILGDM